VPGPIPVFYAMRLLEPRTNSRRWPPLLVAGLTGGIASGKSTVARRFEDLGALILDADEEGRAVVRPGEPALAEIVAAFGPSYLLPDGSLDRRALGDRIFASRPDREMLNRITHPRIGERICSKLRKLASEAAAPQVVVLEAAVLIEAGWAGAVDKIIVVAAQHSTQVARLMAGSRLSHAQAEARVLAQLPLQARLRHADYRIDGEAPISETLDQVSAVWDDLSRLARTQSGCLPTRRKR
jgi:dephospho-CoA kinase